MEQIRRLRKQANDEGSILFPGKKAELQSKYNTSERRESTMHSLLPLDEIDYLINNDLSLDNVYNKANAKFNWSEDLQDMPE